MSIKAWFPTFIYSAPVVRQGFARLNRELLAESLQIRDYDVEGQKWSKKNYPNGFTSYASLCRLHKFSSTFGDLEKLIDRHVRKYTKHLEFDLENRKLEMTDCWVNIMPPGAVHGLHVHPLSTISGTYYVKTPRNCPAIKFEDPRLDRFMAAPPRKAGARDHNRTFVTHTPQAGHIVLFESWLRHEVPQNTVPQERISISFNYSWF